MFPDEQLATTQCSENSGRGPFSGEGSSSSRGGGGGSVGIHFSYVSPLVPQLRVCLVAGLRGRRRSGGGPI
eukprot:10910452-Prorocentrum_lima.AAC.1